MCVKIGGCLGIAHLKALKNPGKLINKALAVLASQIDVILANTARIGRGRNVGTIRVRKDGKDVPHDVMFAFAFHAFFPDGEWMLR